MTIASTSVRGTCRCGEPMALRPARPVGEAPAGPRDVIRLASEWYCPSCGYRQLADQPESLDLVGSPGPVGEELRALLDVAPIDTLIVGEQPTGRTP
jgi:hypothetical protein